MKLLRRLGDAKVPHALPAEATRHTPLRLQLAMRAAGERRSGRRAAQAPEVTDAPPDRAAGPT